MRVRARKHLVTIAMALSVLACSSTSSSSRLTTSSSSTTTTPVKIQHVVWILMENKDYSQIIGSGAAPYINSLANTYGLATNFFAESHPSLPNYIALTSGSTRGIRDDNDPSSHPLKVSSIFLQLPGGGSRSLEESMPNKCAKGNSGEYAVRHNPEAYYVNLRSDCSNYDVPFGSSPNLSAKVTLVTPNVIHDMHDGSIQDGDNYLKGYVPKLLATSQYKAGNTVIFLTWDENSGSSGNHVVTIVISPRTHHVKNGTTFTHYSMLKTVEQIFGLKQLVNAAKAKSMLGKFGF